MDSEHVAAFLAGGVTYKGNLVAAAKGFSGKTATNIFSKENTLREPFEAHETEAAEAMEWINHASGGNYLNNIIAGHSLESKGSAAPASKKKISIMCDQPEVPKYHGVTSSGNKWNARVWIGKKYHFIGTYSTALEAALGYDNAARQHCGNRKKFPVLNFPTDDEKAKEKQKSSRYRGVIKVRNKYIARIWHNKAHMHLGSFDTQVQAALRYDQEAELLKGEKARTNFGGNRHKMVAEAFKASIEETKGSKFAETLDKELDQKCDSVTHKKDADTFSIISNASDVSVFCF